LAPLALLVVKDLRGRGLADVNQRATAQPLSVSVAFIDASVAPVWCDAESGSDQQFDEGQDEFAVSVGWNHGLRDVQQREM
jgi:hypothetical protein